MSENNALKIFLVDDDALCLNLYQQFLKKLGYSQIVCFNGGKDCMDHISQRPDIIFLDYYMDDINGIEVLQAIKSFDNNIAVVFISGQESVDIAVNALKSGAFDYIVKSKISLELLKSIIDRIAADKGITNAPVKKSFMGRIKSNFRI
jgi:DNA-binding NtrC family response regulator